MCTVCKLFNKNGNIWSNGLKNAKINVESFRCNYNYLVFISSPVRPDSIREYKLMQRIKKRHRLFEQFLVQIDEEKRTATPDFDAYMETHITHTDDAWRTQITYTYDGWRAHGKPALKLITQQW